MDTYETRMNEETKASDVGGIRHELDVLLKLWVRGLNENLH